MKLTNGDKTVELTAPGTIDAYLSEGWTEVIEEEKPKPEKKPAKSKQ